MELRFRDRVCRYVKEKREIAKEKHALEGSGVKAIDRCGTFLRVRGNRFRERKGTALIALPGRSHGL